MKTYVISSNDDLRFVTEKWLIHDVRGRGWYGFDTKEQAMRFAYKVLTKNYKERSKGNVLGLMRMYKMPFKIGDPGFLFGWYDGHPCYEGYMGINRILSTGKTKNIHWIGD